MKREYGFTLVELLIGLFISSLMIIALSMSFISGVRASEKSGANFSKYQSTRLFFLTFEKDLRNVLAYSSLPFRGKQEELVFPSFTYSRSGGGKGLLKIRYFLKDHKLIRMEETMKEVFREKEPKEKPVLPQVEEIRFSYPYREDTGHTLFLPFWLEEPYQGLPKAVKVDLELKDGIRFSKLISIPQGRLGTLAEKEA